MSYRVGTGYFSSPNIMTSEAGVDLIPQHKPESWSIAFKAYKFSFVNDQACHISVNDEPYGYLRAGQGFEMDYIDAQIYSFKIQENGITYSYWGGY